VHHHVRVKERFRRGAAADRRAGDEKVQRRLRELAGTVEQQPAAAVAIVAPADETQEPGPPAVESTRRKAPRRRRNPRRIALVVLVLLVTWILVWQIDLRRPHGWRSEAEPGARLTAWPSPPAGASTVPLGQPPTDVPLADTYEFRATQGGPDDPVTYDPCVPIHFVVNDRKAFDGAAEELDEAIAEVEKATGLVMVDDGQTDEAPVNNRALQDEHYGASWSPVLIAWSDGYEAPDLKGGVAGYGGSRSVTHAGRRWYVTGSMVLDGPQLNRMYRGTNGPERVRALIMHELGHVIGLGHVGAPGELMQPGAGDVASWGPGDRAGLAQLGAGQCVGG
jgi:hypothetical protein